MPGKYTVSMAKRVNGVVTPLAGPQSFEVVVDGAATMAAADRAALVDFQQKVARLQRAVVGTLESANALKSRLALIKRALQETPAAPLNLTTQANEYDKRLNQILIALRGDVILAARYENVPPSVSSRVGQIVAEQATSTSRPTATQLEQYRIASEELQQELARLRVLIETDVAQLEKAMEAAGAPWTPGRLPTWGEK
jgi:hypothetical protein